MIFYKKVKYKALNDKIKIKNKKDNKLQNIKAIKIINVINIERR